MTCFVFRTDAPARPDGKLRFESWDADGNWFPCRAEAQIGDLLAWIRCPPSAFDSQYEDSQGAERWASLSWLFLACGSLRTRTAQRPHASIWHFPSWFWLVWCIHKRFSAWAAAHRNTSYEERCSIWWGLWGRRGVRQADARRSSAMKEDLCDGWIDTAEPERGVQCGAPAWVT